MKLSIVVLFICIFISCKTSPYKVPPGGYYVPESTPSTYTTKSEPLECFACQGTGRIDCSVCQGSGLGSMCYSCDGAGRIYSQFGGWSKCYSCNGRGYSKCFSCSGRGQKKCFYCNGRGYNK